MSGTGSNPVTGFFRQDTFPQFPEIRSTGGEKPFQISVTIREQNLTYPSFRRRAIIREILPAFVDPASVSFPRPLQSFDVQAQDFDGSLYLIRHHPDLLASSVVRLDSTIEAHTQERRKSRERSRIDEIRFRVIALCLAATDAWESFLVGPNRRIVRRPALAASDHVGGIESARSSVLGMTPRYHVFDLPVTAPNVVFAIAA